MRRHFPFMSDIDFYNRHGNLLIIWKSVDWWKPSNHLEVCGLELKIEGCLPLRTHLCVASLYLVVTMGTRMYQ